jgi:2-hydroxy-3-oxopropionate reductase
MAPGALVIIMSSITVDEARRQAARVTAAGGRYIDAPVSGGQKGAEEARLTIMAGGAAADIDAALPVLNLLGRVTRVGDVGAGQLAKLANQMIVGITIGAVSEAMLLLKAGGADLAAAHQALMGGFADSSIWRLHGKRIIDGDFRPGGRAVVQLKDLRNAMEQAATTGLDLPILGLLRDLYQQACDHGHGDLDHSALYLELAERSVERPS